MLLTVYAKIRSQNCMTTVIIDSEDTYVLVQSAYVPHQVHEQLLIKIKELLVDC